MERPYIVIPALNPTESLVDLIRQLRSNGLERIIVVDDGSREDLKYIFKKCKEEFGCILLTHIVNQGKGRALKNAFNYYLQNDPNGCGVITIDSDGQHQVSDVIKCEKELLRGKNELILGIRNFDDKTVPFKSKFGNKLTCILLRVLCGIKVADSQTGLRGIPRELIKLCLGTVGERFEYETNMLLDCHEKDVPICEIPIQTVYINSNAESHFNPVVDSFRIYSIFFKYIIASLSSFIVDIVAFSGFISLFRFYDLDKNIFLSTILARVLSSGYNYFINHKLVFRSDEKMKITVLKYYILCILQVMCSAFLVKTIAVLTAASLIAIKILVDCILFFFSFQIQKIFIFKGKRCR